MMRKIIPFFIFTSVIMACCCSPFAQAGLLDRIQGVKDNIDDDSPGGNQNEGNNPPASNPKNYAADLLKASGDGSRVVNIKKDGTVQNVPLSQPVYKREPGKQIQGIAERAKRTQELNEKIEQLQAERIKAQGQSASTAQVKELDHKIEEVRQEFKQDLGRDPLGSQGLLNQPTGGEPAPVSNPAAWTGSGVSNGLAVTENPANKSGGPVDEDADGNFDPDKYDEYVEKGGKVDSQGRPVTKPVTEGSVPGAGKPAVSPSDTIPTGPWTGSGNSNGPAVTDAPSSPVKVDAPGTGRKPAVDEDESGNFDPDKYDEYVERGGRTDAEGRPTPEKPITDGPVENAGKSDSAPETWTGSGNSNGLAVTDAPGAGKPREKAVDEDDDGNFDPDKYDEYVEKGGKTDSNGRPIPEKPITDGPVPGTPDNPITDGPVDPNLANPPAAKPDSGPAKGASPKAKEQANQPLGGPLGSALSEVQETGELIAARQASEDHFLDEVEKPLYNIGPWSTAEDIAANQRIIAENEAIRARNKARKEKKERDNAEWDKKEEALKQKHELNAKDRAAKMKDIGEQMKSLMKQQAELLTGPVASKPSSKPVYKPGLGNGNPKDPSSGRPQGDDQENRDKNPGSLA